MPSRGRSQVIFRTSEDLVAATDLVAERTGETRSDVIRRVLAEFVSQELGREVIA